MSTNALGPLVRLRGLRTEQLPAASASADDLAPLLLAILQEAVPFIDSAAPKASADAKPDPKVWKLKGTHAHPDSKARVEVLERIVLASELEKVEARSSSSSGGGGGGGAAGDGVKDVKVKGETWCCRRSVHADAAERGTASWEEFVRSFRDEHAQSEKAFTPACLAAHEAQSWDCAGVGEVEEGGVRWGAFKLVVEEMRHRIGKPVLKDRTFPVLQMTATALGPGPGQREFLVVSIPVPDYGEKSDRSKLAKEKGAQVAFYVSVERIRAFGGGEGQGKIEWLMATASDAAGVLPAWVQNLAAPGVIWKDVPMFLGWIARERGKRAKTKTKDVVPNGGGKKKEEKARSSDADGDRGTIPRVSSGVEVGSLPTVSEETSNDDEFAASPGPQVSTGVEVGQTAKVSGSA